LDNGLTAAQVRNTREEILETYFLEKGRFDRYYAPLGIKKEALRKIIVNEEDERKTASELVDDIMESLKDQRNVINSKTTGRDNFSLVKYNKEIVSRAKKIYKIIDF